MEAAASDTTAEGVYDQAKPSRFQFKSGSKRPSKRHESGDDGRDASGDDHSTRRSRRESRRRHKHKHRSSRHAQHPTSTRDGSYYDADHRHRESLYDHVDATGASPPGVAPDDAFRESLFDALADDEGAAYWEGVYGQPVHVYPEMKQGPDGQLERMSEDEYAEYVRTKMWEKSHQHIVEEREAREKARQQKKDRHRHLDEDMERDEADRETIRRRMAESLRKGEERKRAREADAAWESYLAKWDDLKNAQLSTEATDSNARHLIPWPVLSGAAKHVSSHEIESFLRGSRAWGEDAPALLKAERVRWHPDKMQQRFGQHIDHDTMKLVTAVFQVVDRLWNDRR